MSFLHRSDLVCNSGM